MATPSLYHWLPLPAFEVKVTEPLTQNVVAEAAVMEGVAGIGFTVTFILFDDDDSQPLILTLTE
jgi:hypothetical protein